MGNTIGSGGSSAASSGGSSKKVSSSSNSSSASSTKKKSSSSSASSANKREKVTISKGANKTEKPNAMAEGIKKNWADKGLEANDGNKLGKYTKGGEGTVEKELLKKGFTLKEIYTKDKQGRTLADQVAQTNGIKNQKKIADGKELTLPQRPGAQGISASEVKNGEKKSVEVQNGSNSAQQSIEKGANGDQTIRQATTADGPQGPNTARVVTQAPPGSTSVGAVAKDGPEVVNNNLTQAPNNEAITRSEQRTRNGDVLTTLADADKNKNSTVNVTDGGITMNNPDGATKGIDSTIKMGPQSGTERFGRWVDNLAPSWTGAQRTTAPQGPVGGVSQVDGAQRPDGSANYTIRQGNGQTQTVDQTARGTFQNVGKRVSDTIDRIGSRLGSWFGSNNTTSGGGIPAEQIFSPSGTII